jgi:hypothetical protein
MGKKPFVLAFSFLFVASLTLLSQERSKEKKIGKDERLAITVDKVERADLFPEKFRNPNFEDAPPEKGNDYVLIHISVVEKRDLKVALGEHRLARPDSPHLIDDQGNTHWASFAQYNILVGMSSLFGKGGCMVFQMPKNATPVQLRFVYPYREDAEKPKEIKYGQIDIDLSRAR